MSISEPRAVPFDRSLPELEKLGSPVDLDVIAEQLHDRQIHIEQSDESLVYGLENGLLGCALHISVLNRASQYVHIDEPIINFAGSDGLFQWLKPSRNGESAAAAYYRFPGKNGDVFCSDVINRVLTQDKRLPPGRFVSGWLLAIGGATPRDLFAHRLVEAEIIVKITDGEEYRASVECLVEYVKRPIIWRPARPSLFDEQIPARRPIANPGIFNDSHESGNHREGHPAQHVTPRAGVRTSAGAKLNADG